MNRRLWAKASVFALVAGICAPQMAAAQDAVDVLRDEILVTATKKADAENVQDVPLAVTAYGSEQLDALKVRDLQNLSYSVPNVQLEDVGTARGVANFSIRGLGVNSSIPSIDPAVGTFVNGIYLGQNGGVVLDIFDLESVEVLRGPQGILFGRNVTGGAVLINNKRPNLSEATFDAKFAVETGARGTGINYYAMGGVSAPLIEDRLALRIAAYYNSDDGYFKNYLGGPNLNEKAISLGGTFAALQALIAQDRPDAFANHGEADTWIIRPSLLWAPSDSVEILLRYEHFDSQGEGPASQNHPGFLPGFVTAGGTRVPPTPISNLFFSAPKNSFTMSIDEPGFYTAEADSITAEINIDVGDNARITNIFGWRDTSGVTRSDIDGTPFHLFHAEATNNYKQLSNELRYAGRWWDAVDTTFGFYYFTADHEYQENRFILGNFRRFFGGGLQDSRNYGVFGQVDVDITDEFTLIGGVRYTNERKEVALSNITLGLLPAPNTCSVADGTCTVHFTESNTWTNVTPKAGFRWEPTDELNIYGHWTEGVRSGGYNFRNTSVVFPIARFEEETVDAFELGFKATPSNRAVINAAVFVNKVNDMQREINLPDAVAGVVQLIRNTADATIFGFEIESQVFLTDNLVFMGNIGHLNGDYSSVAFNLNSDFIDLVTGLPTTTGQQNPGDPDIIDGFDEALQIPRLAPWTYGAGFVHSWDWGNLGTMTTRFQWSHRDDNAYTDNNLGILEGADMIDLSFALRTFNDHATISLYGQNLLDEVTHGGETQLPSTLGFGTFAPLNKGRIIGIELQLDI